MKRVSSILLVLQVVCLLISGIMLAKPAYHIGRRHWARLQAAHRWEQVLNTPVADLNQGDPAGWLRIPAIGFDDLVLYGDQEAFLHQHACVAQQTPMVILGHRDTHFHRMKNLKQAQHIEFQDRQGQTQVYRVQEIEILPADIVRQRIQEHRNPKSLILMTCYPFQYIGPAPQRFLVWAEPLSEARSSMIL